jgi:hypothetical protein
VPPVSCPGILLPRGPERYAALSMPVVLWHNTVMRRWLFPVIAALAGIAAGLVYGWIINPVKFVDTTPASLRVDYRTDYVLMVAEAFHADQDVELAGRRLAILGAGSPAAISVSALDAAQEAGYSQPDIALLQELRRALQASQPVPSAPGGTP